MFVWIDGWYTVMLYSCWKSKPLKGRYVDIVSHMYLMVFHHLTMTALSWCEEMWDPGQITEISFYFCAPLPTINSLNMFLVGTQSLNPNRDPDKSLHISSSAGGEEFLLRCSRHVGGGCSRWPVGKPLQSPRRSHTYWWGGEVKWPRLSGGVEETETHKGSRFMEDDHCLLFCCSLLFKEIRGAE